MYRKDKEKDFFTEKSKKEGYPARSIYKLKEIDEKYDLFRKGDNVLDLGCVPGSWLLYVSDKVGDNGSVLGIDIEDIKIPLKKNIRFIKKDVLDFKKTELNQKYHSVVSDLAPSTCGIRFIDAGNSLKLSRKALEIAKTVLLLNGSFVCKIFEGEFSDNLIKEIGKNFKLVKRFKPKAVSKSSKEFYVIGKYFYKD